MKRILVAALLMLLNASAFAGDSTSHNYGGRRTQYEASRDCRSASCARHDRDRYRDDDDDDDDFNYRRDRRTDERALPPAAESVSPPPPAVATRAPAVYRPAATSTQIVPPPARLTVPPAPPPLAAPPAAKAVEPARGAPPPQAPRAANNIEDDAGTLLGDWRTEAKGLVRIAKCGKAFCGYVLSSLSNEMGEIVLVNMKPKGEDQWSGSVYSQASGDTYYGTIDIKDPNTLRVEACAVGRFYCSGNNWSRVNAKAGGLLSSRQGGAQPRS
jgi:hypothetical protein